MILQVAIIPPRSGGSQPHASLLRQVFVSPNRQGVGIDQVDAVCTLGKLSCEGKNTPCAGASGHLPHGDLIQWTVAASREGGGRDHQQTSRNDPKHWVRRSSGGDDRRPDRGVEFACGDGSFLRYAENGRAMSRADLKVAPVTSHEIIHTQRADTSNNVGPG